MPLPPPLKDATPHPLLLQPAPPAVSQVSHLHPAIYHIPAMAEAPVTSLNPSSTSSTMDIAVVDDMSSSSMGGVPPSLQDATLLGGALASLDNATATKVDGSGVTAGSFLWGTPTSLACATTSQVDGSNVPANSFPLHLLGNNLPSGRIGQVPQYTAVQLQEHPMSATLDPSMWSHQSVPGYFSAPSLVHSIGAPLVSLGGITIYPPRLSVP
mmetsp:Transcript_13676/g.30169  ORF Transcript_13676/g.30169 Transcript_13676/m.30169 type:complete len:212 (-) Transcript_13676:1616-2251(-)